MKKLFCIVVVLFIFIGASFSQSAPKFGETVLFLNKEEVKSLMKEYGFKKLYVRTVRSEKFGNALCDVISGSSDWCPMCHVFFKKGNYTPTYVDINFVAYSSGDAIGYVWKDAGYEILKAFDSELTLILVKDRQGQKYSFLAKIQTVSSRNGGYQNTTLQKIPTPK
jgi:hypothetical protein